MLKVFLNKIYFEDYLPSPHHMIYPVLMLATGFKCLMYYNWQIFGVLMIIGACLFALVIMFGIAWRGPIEYWEKIRQTVEVMNRIKSPEVWTALGFKSLPQTITIQEKKVDEHGVTQQWIFKKPEISPVMLNMIANKVLLSGTLDFTEELYKDKISNFRKVQKDLKEKGYIVPKNKKNVRNGYVWSRKGVDVLYQFADQNVLKLIEKEDKNGEQK